MGYVFVLGICFKCVHGLKSSNKIYQLYLSVFMCPVCSFCQENADTREVNMS